jgi:hypothetical protein
VNDLAAHAQEPGRLGDGVLVLIHGHSIPRRAPLDAMGTTDTDLTRAAGRDTLGPVEPLGTV